MEPPLDPPPDCEPAWLPDSPPGFGSPPAVGVAPELEPEFGMPELPLGDEDPGLGSDGIDEPAPALPPELLLSDPELLELEEDELDEELPDEPDEPDDDDDEEGDDGDGIEEGICCSVWQPPIRKAPVALAAANCNAMKQARFSAAR